MRPPAASTRGFTLIEVLVSLAVMSLIGCVLVASLQIGGHTWQRVTREAADAEEIRRAQDFLRQRLSSMYPFARSESALPQPAAFVGAEDALEFSGPGTSGLGEALVRYQITLSDDGVRSMQVRYRRDRNGLPDPLAPTWRTETLLNRISSLSFQFWQSGPGSGGQWLANWSGQHRTPRLIRVDVRFPANDRRRWPPLFIEPRIDTNTECAFDVVSQRCRSGV
jgi:prepilin-type N-terminal cleavage/methylation domain-containing protein